MSQRAFDVPSDVQAERAVIGCLLLNPSLVRASAGSLASRHFGDAACKAVYEAIRRLASRGHLPDYITLSGELGRTVSDAELAEIVSTVSSADNFDGYMQRLINVSRRRQMYRAGYEIIKDVEERPDAELDIAVSHAMSQLHAVDSATGTSPVDQYNIARAADWLKDHKQEVQTRGAQHNLQYGSVLVTTGIDKLDHALYGGVDKECLFVIGAWPGTGKTAMSLQMVLNQARRGMSPVIYSYEMGKNRLTMRLACCVAGVNGQRVRQGMLTKQEFDRVEDALDELSRMDITIIDTPPTSTPVLMADAIYRQRVNGSDVFYIDHIGFVQPDRSMGKENVDIKLVMNDLARLRDTVKCPIFALSQLSMGDKQKDSQATKKLLYGSIFIDAVADYVAILNRPSKSYEGDTERLVVSIEKNRDGEECRVDLAYTAKYGRVE